MIAVALQVLVVVMMVAIGLELRVAQIVEGLRQTKWLLAAFVLNLVIVPVVVWSLAEASTLAPGMVAGLVLLAAAPAGPIGPLLSRLSHADLGFSTGLMVVLGALGLLSTPITVRLLVDVETERDLLIPMFTTLLISQIIPLLVAMGVGARFPEIAVRAARPFQMVSNLLLVAIVVALLVVRGEVLTDTSWTVHFALVGGLLIVLAPVLILSPGSSVMRSLLTVTAVRNMSVALFLAARFFDDPLVEVAILIWSFWMLVVTGLIGALAGRYRTVGATEPSVGERSPERTTLQR